MTLKEFLTSNGFDFLENEPMKLHTSFKIGGPARLFINVKTSNELSLLLAFLSENNLNYFILGNGTNLLVSDKGVNTPIIHLCGEFDSIELIGDDVIKVGAAVSVSRLCKFALKNSLSKIEFAYGIPGLVGGAVFMNAGAYGGEFKDVVFKVDSVLKNGDLTITEGDDLNFGYRKSKFSCSNEIVTFAYLKLTKGDKNEISKKMNELLTRRKEKQPLDFPSAGSTFKRPEGYFAGKLIEDSGLKGKKIGGAMVSVKHAGFVINYDNATFDDVKNLIDFCKQTVFQKFGVKLETEVLMLED